ncbi:hypothetical protein J5N97_020745 [Dioscorea zingiberensis]|uniref:Elongation factor Tu n=1 Tax=Dioscorea zingiberensis TaxID=325984 RepID=A0A9D5CGD2_9LILI|nr:hypothetical protein J5N97_020745 [Dioscorea zingiberensis]
MTMAAASKALLPSPSSSSKPKSRILSSSWSLIADNYTTSINLSGAGARAQIWAAKRGGLLVVRAARGKFERKKPHLNIGTIGHVDHGKTTLTAALTMALASLGNSAPKKYDEIDAAPEERARGRGTVATGRVERGTVKVGETVDIVGLRPTRNTTVTGVEMFQKILDEALAGDNVGLLLRGMQKADIQRGMVLAKPGTITPHTKFAAIVYVLKKEEGGRHSPFFAGYRPQFYMRTTDVTGKVTSIMNDKDEESKMVMPGDRVKMIVELIMPIACEQGMRFAIREGGKTVGAGVIQSIIE